MKFGTKIASLVTVAQLASADYLKVVSETCPQLQDPTTFFESFLVPCADFKADAGVELVCINDQAEKNELLKTVPDWTYVPDAILGDKLVRTFVFADFKTAFLFMTKSAQLAEKNQHHPDWRNLYNTVTVTATTDDKFCLSSYDFELAQGMDLLVKENFALNLFLN